MGNVFFEHIHLIGKRDLPYTAEGFSSKKILAAVPQQFWVLAIPGSTETTSTAARN